MPYNNGVYRTYLDRVALKILTVPAFVPNPNLQIDMAAANEPFNLAYHQYSPKAPTVVLPDPAAVPIEETGVQFTGNPVDPALFPMNFYMGPPIGGV